MLSISQSFAIYTKVGICFLLFCFLGCSTVRELTKDPATVNPVGKIPGFVTSPHFDEQISTYTFTPEVKIHINAPAEDQFDFSKPTRLILFTLPNGNSTEQTIGKKLKPGIDWHFGIQHIGAQTRQLRENIKDENIIVAYLEAEKKSWPSWRSKNPESNVLISKVIDSVVEHLPGIKPTIALASHSGGGSFIFGYLNGTEKIADNIKRLSFIDSNYGYTDEERHGDKIIEWLKRSNDTCLSVICYDDRNVRYDGKLIVSATGGTYRMTQKMVDKLKTEFELTQTTENNCIIYRGLAGRIDIIMHTNPTNIILHTILVELNGFIQAMTSGTRYDNKIATFYGPVSYEKWIQED